MVQYGTYITKPDDELKKIPVERLFQAIVNPKETLRSQVERLRMVRDMDPKQYGRLKRELPYFVCGQFHPPFRRRENFAAIEYFVVDLDHFQEADKDAREVARQLKDDPRLVLSFTSPGGDGLKLLFRLSEKCHDSGLYALFYKAFIRSLAVKYGLEQVIDARTHDVTRACFLSVDAEAYFNPGAEPVVLEQVFDPADPDAQRRVAEQHRELREQAPAGAAPEKEPLSDDVLLQIKQKLNPNFRPKKERNIFVPPELETVIPKVEERLREMNMELKSSEPIHYGKKLTVTAGNHWAEVNLFFGKRGFSVVKTTKSGSNPELADAAFQVLYEMLTGD